MHLQPPEDGRLGYRLGRGSVEQNPCDTRYTVLDTLRRYLGGICKYESEDVFQFPARDLGLMLVEEQVGQKVGLLGVVGLFRHKDHVVTDERVDVEV